MRVRHLDLTDFRNYSSAEVDFEAGANLFVGRNGQGKTNLVEALGFLATLGSHRVSSDAPLVRAGTDAAIIRARIAHDDREVLLEAQINRAGANRAQVNRAKARPRDLSRYFASVLFAPEDLLLVRGDPGARRRFLDQLVVQRHPRLAGVLADYERVLRQRHTLLKTARHAGPNGLGTLDVWDDRLVDLGAEIMDERLRLVAELAGPLAAAYIQVAGAEHGPGVAMVHSIDADAGDVELDGPAPEDVPLVRAELAERMRAAVARVRSRELERGVTLVGPHRDDLVLRLNALPARGYASHGESWSFALALKLASAQLLRAESNSGDPVLILDDVFAELDQERRRRLLGAVSDYEQVLVTSAVEEDVPRETSWTVHRVVAGSVTAG